MKRSGVSVLGSRGPEAAAGVSVCVPPAGCPPRGHRGRQGFMALGTRCRVEGRKGSPGSWGVLALGLWVSWARLASPGLPGGLPEEAATARARGGGEAGLPAGFAGSEGWLGSALRGPRAGGRSASSHPESAKPGWGGSRWGRPERQSRAESPGRPRGSQVATLGCLQPA